jgi:Leucine-rich repeat (LRR) protein
VEGLQYCAALGELALSSNKVTDITPLGGLRQLKTLDLRWNQVTDLSPLARCRKLTMARLDDNRIRSVAVLAVEGGVPAGAEIHLRGNPIDCERQAVKLERIRSRGVRLECDCP